MGDRISTVSSVATQKKASGIGKNGEVSLHEFDRRQSFQELSNI